MSDAVVELDQAFEGTEGWIELQCLWASALPFMGP